jgi:hypothetical protein
MSTPDVLVLGGSDAGKTHYAGQLLGRLRHDRQGKLRLRPGGVDDLSKLEEVLSCLNEGRAAGHTPAETWTGIRCALETANGDPVLLEWPEYAGERLFSIIERRVLSTEWQGSVKAAKGWMLFLRPSILKLYEDLLNRPTAIAPKHAAVAHTSVDGRRWDDRARYVELLQILLFAAGRSTFHKASIPRLAIVLSCWDEIGSQATPDQELSDRLPMLNAFVQSNWQAEAWSVWGLSSLGRSLSQDDSDEEFVIHGPECFGYVIPPGTTQQDSDLTAPVAWLLEV